MDHEPAASADQEPGSGTQSRRRRPRGRLHEAMHRHPLLSVVTKTVVTGIGVLVLGAGLVMLVTPGPGLVGIVIGLAILATEWDWADALLDRARRKLDEARQAAARVDPQVRRRRTMLGLGALVVVVGLGVGLVVAFGWPGFVVDGWGWVQSLAGWVPDLPGM